MNGTCRREATVPAEYEPLILDPIEWVARRPRPYGEVMDAWRTSCPRLPVWEDAVERGLVAQRSDAGEAMVRVTAAGLDYLKRHGRCVAQDGALPRVADL